MIKTLLKLENVEVYSSNNVGMIFVYFFLYFKENLNELDGQICQCYFTNKEIGILLSPCSYNFKMLEQETEHRSSVSLFSDCLTASFCHLHMDLL